MNTSAQEGAARDDLATTGKRNPGCTEAGILTPELASFAFISRTSGHSDLIPTLRLVGFKLGVSPLLQCVVLPPLSLHQARRKV